MPGALFIEGEYIKDVMWGEPDPPCPDGYDIIDAKGLIIAPGLIDMCVFTGEPGAEHKETLASASAAAAAGGVTTMVVMPDTDPIIDDAALVDFIMRRARDTACVNVRPMAALTKGLAGATMTEMGLLLEAGAVGFTNGTQPISNAQVMRRAMSYATLFDAVVAHQPEEPTLANGTSMNDSELSSRLGLSGAPKAAETIMLARDIELARLTGVRYHAAQISCAESVEQVRAAKESGVNMTCAVSAHHLGLNENDIGNYRTFMKVRPPLRSEDDRRALVEAVAEGIIDIVVSAHRPQGPEDKRLPFAEAADGCVGLETLLPVLLERVHNSDLTLLEALRPVTSNPADLLRLETGRLAAGAPADLIMLNLGEPFQLKSADLHSKNRNTPFDGHRFQGRIKRTFVRGQTVFTP